MVWHFQLVLWATLCHCPWTWRSPAASTPPPPDFPLTHPTPLYTVLQKQPTTMLPCGTAWVAKTATPVPPFNPVSSVPPSPLSLQQRSSLIRDTVAVTDWWCGQGAADLWSFEMLGEAVGWGVERISAGARGHWTVGYPRVIAFVCLFSDLFLVQQRNCYIFFFNFKHLLGFDMKNLFFGISQETQRHLPGLLSLAAIGSFSMSNY